MTAVDTRPDIASRADIAQLVTDFYTRCFSDDLLGVVFVEVAHLDLDAHLPVMCDFWETVLFRTASYGRNALQVHTDLHARSPLTAAHCGRWLEIWNGTVDDSYVGPKADLAKRQAARIAWSMSRRLMGESGSEFVTITRGQR